MTENQRALAKGALLVTVLKKRSHLTKAYLALAAAAIYGIRAARAENVNLDSALEALDNERSRPVVVMEPTE